MGRFIGGRFGDTVNSQVTLDNASAVFTQYDYYYMKREGGLANPSGFSISSYAVDGTPTGTTEYNNVAIDQTVTLTAAGRHVVTVPSGSGDITFTGWAWGGGGGSAGAPGPGGGAAGGGVRGDFTITSPNDFTIFVGNGSATGPGWPDGGTSTSTYFTAPGGGSSRIGNQSGGTMPHDGSSGGQPNHPSASYYLIGGAGGGGSDYLSGGTLKGQGGYPGGYRGGAYYPSDPGADGRGGTQTAGGAGGPAGRRPAGTAGSKYQGGNSGTNGGGGGGGGFYGGGGAGGYYAHGGGGSSYFHPTVTNTASFDATPGADNFAVASDDPGNPGTKPTNAGNGRNPGCVVLKVSGLT